MSDRDVKAPLTNKRGRYVETREFMGMIRRGIRALVRRVGDQADVEMLPDMLQLQADLDHAVVVAVAGLRARGYSWAEIAARTGTTKQAAQQRWGGKIAALEAA